MREDGRRQVMQAASLVGAALLLSRIVGLVRDVIIQRELGTVGVGANAYALASQFPEAIFYVIAGGAIGSAFIPTFATYFAQDDEAGAWRLFSGVINLLTLVVTGVAVVTAVFAPQLVAFFFRDQITRAPEILPLAVQLMRIMLLSSIIFGISGVIMGALNARQHFLLPALAPTVYNVGIIVGGVLLEPAATGLAWGTVGGALGHLLIQLPGLWQKQARYEPVLTVNDPGIQQVLRLMGPRVLGLSFSQLNNFITLFLTGSATLALGSLPAVKLAFRMMILPQGVIGQGLGIAAFPTLATLAAQQAYVEMRRIISDALRVLLFLGLPITVGLMLLREPLITILFERGLFDEQSTQFAAWALLFYAIGLAPLTALEVIARAFYALSDTWTPVLAGAAQIVLMSLLSYWFSQALFPALGWLPHGGLALGFSVSNMLEVLLLLWLLRRKLGRLNGRLLLDGLWRMGVAALLMGVGIWVSNQLLADGGSAWQLLVGGVVGSLIYLLACLLLRVSELHGFLNMIRRRLQRVK